MKIQPTTKRQDVSAAVRREAKPLRSAADLDELVQAAAPAKVVLLGEASHGTSEFYRWRAELTKRLIARHGFQFIAVEGDWPPCYEINRYIKRYAGAKPSLADAMRSFDRWPAWMWANEEVRELVAWLYEHNGRVEPAGRVGFYGLDVYSLWESMEEVIRHLERTGRTELLATAKQAFSCFEPHGREGQQYGVAAVYWAESCEDEVVRLLHELQMRRCRIPREQAGEEAEAALSDELNALVARNAEQYYRQMIRSDSGSWNVRDEHMTEALDRLLAFHGPEAKAIVWEHNTHIGDARATDMAAEGMVNVGQLVRERYGRERCCAVGFGTHGGTVIAGKAWGAQAETMRVPDAVEGSWEQVLHDAGGGRDLLLLFRRDAGDACGVSAGAQETGSGAPEAGESVTMAASASARAHEVPYESPLGEPLAPESPCVESHASDSPSGETESHNRALRAAAPSSTDPFLHTFDHRAIGVIYHPGREHWGNYVPSVMADRYDAFVFIDRSEALHPLVLEKTEV